MPGSLTHPRFTNICARTCPRDLSVGWEAVAPQSITVWCTNPARWTAKDRNRPSQARASGHECPPSRVSTRTPQPSPDSPSLREASSGSFKDTTKVVPPRKDWGGFNHRTGDPSLCTPSGPYRILSGPFPAVALLSGRSGQWGRGTSQITLFAHLQLGLFLELQNQGGFTG